MGSSMIYKAVNLHAWRAVESTLGLPGENRNGGGRESMLFMGTMTLFFQLRRRWVSSKYTQKVMRRRLLGEVSTLQLIVEQ